MTPVTVWRDGIGLCLHDGGGPGRPVVMQHGLTGAVGQIAEWLPATAAVRPITLECRGHGGSGAGPAEGFGIATFADDVIAAIGQLGLGPLVLGGISMGAAIASRIAVRRPDLVSGLILIRPAWTTEAAPDSMEPNAVVGGLMRDHPPAEARARFAASATAARLAREAPDNLASLLSFFDRQPADVTADLLIRISRDGPGIVPADLSRLTVPALVVGTGRDIIHPLDHARTLAGLIPGARFAEITPKASDKSRHLADLAAVVTAFVASLA